MHSHQHMWLCVLPRQNNSYGVAAKLVSQVWLTAFRYLFKAFVSPYTMRFGDLMDLVSVLGHKIPPRPAFPNGFVWFLRFVLLGIQECMTLVDWQSFNDQVDRAQLEFWLQSHLHQPVDLGQSWQNERCESVLLWRQSRKMMSVRWRLAFLGSRGDCLHDIYLQLVLSQILELVYAH